MLIIINYDDAAVYIPTKGVEKRQKVIKTSEKHHINERLNCQVIMISQVRE